MPYKQPIAMLTKLCLPGDSLTKSTITFSFLLFTSFAHAQQQQYDLKSELQQLVISYKQMFLKLDMEGMPGKKEFEDLFYTQEIKIVNDYYTNGTDTFKTPGEYFDDITVFFLQDASNVKTDTIKVQDASDAFYCKRGNNYYIWLHKSFCYKYKGQQKRVQNWLRLKAMWIEGISRFKIASIETADQRPDDTDNDHIADFCDTCIKYTIKEVNIDGCEMKPPFVATEISPQKEIPKETVTQSPVIGKDEGKKRREWDWEWLHNLLESKNPAGPSSRYSLELTGGGVLPFGTLANKKLFDYDTNNWVDSGGMANVGYTGGIAAQLHMTKWLGAGIGYHHFFVPFESARLKLQIENFLGRIGQDYWNVSVRPTAYRMHLFYTQLTFGNLQAADNVFKVEPLIGKMNTRFSTNNVQVQINYASGNDQSTRVSFQAPSFFVYGSKISFQKSLGGSGKIRAQISAYYLRGHTGIQTQEIAFDHHTGKVKLALPDVQLGGISAGLHLTLKSSENN